MAPKNIKAWEEAETERSVSAANRVDVEKLKIPNSRIERYLAPPTQYLARTRILFCTLG